MKNLLILLLFGLTVFLYINRDPEKDYLAGFRQATENVSQTIQQWRDSEYRKDQRKKLAARFEGFKSEIVNLGQNVRSEFETTSVTHTPDEAEERKTKELLRDFMAKREPEPPVSEEN